MITALHTLIYSDRPAATRRFLSEVLGWKNIGGSGPEDWLIFRSGPSETGVHPTTGEGFSTPRHHEIALMCDDLAQTMDELAERGAEFRGEPEDRGFGLCVPLVVPGADDFLLYQPQHETAYDFRTPDMGVVGPIGRI